MTMLLRAENTTQQAQHIGSRAASRSDLLAKSLLALTFPSPHCCAALSISIDASSQTFECIELSNLAYAAGSSLSVKRWSLSPETLNDFS